MLDLVAFIFGTLAGFAFFARVSNFYCMKYHVLGKTENDYTEFHNDISGESNENLEKTDKSDKNEKPENQFNVASSVASSQLNIRDSPVNHHENNAQNVKSNNYM